MSEGRQTSSRRASAILVIGVWAVAVLLGFWLGWSFNAGYYGTLGGFGRRLVRALSWDEVYSGPGALSFTTYVLQAMLSIECVVAIAAIAATLRRFLPARKTRVLTRFAALCPPLVFAVTAIALRSMTTVGILGPSGAPELERGESFVMAGARYTRTAFGVGVENLFDSRTVVTILWDDTRYVWANHALLILVAVALWLWLAVTVLIDWRRREQ